MPEIQINHFIAYLAYNNNSDGFMFDRADGGYDPDRRIAVEYATSGAAVFRLDRVNIREKPNVYAANILQKIEFYQKLHAGLMEEFGRGLGIAIAPTSDCSDDREIALFCKAMKEMDPAITTIVMGNPHRYIPENEENRLRSLSDEWRFEPYDSAKLVCGIDVEPRQSSVPALLKDGIDYVGNGYRGGINKAYDVIYEVMGVDRNDIPVNNYQKEDYVSVNSAVAAKIQEIADRAFCDAMGVTYDPQLDDNFSEPQPR